MTIILMMSSPQQNSNATNIVNNNSVKNNNVKCNPNTIKTMATYNTKQPVKQTTANDIFTNKTSVG